MCSCSAKRRRRYFSTVKSGTVQITFRRKYTTAPTSKKAIGSDSSCRSMTSSPNDEAVAAARRAFRPSDIGCGPIMKSVSSLFVPSPTCWEKYVPPGCKTLAISLHKVKVGWRLATSSNASSGNGKSDSSEISTSETPKRSKFVVAIATLGLHDSEAKMTRGLGSICESTSANRSPPPVWTSKTDCALAIRSRNASEYFHEGRPSIALPSNQEKSQPSVGSELPSASSCSNFADVDIVQLCRRPRKDEILDRLTM